MPPPLMSGRRFHHSAIFPGQVRFNSKSGFDPEFPLRAIGKTFLCSGPANLRERCTCCSSGRTAEMTPDAYLVTLKSAEHGAIQFRQTGLEVAGVQSHLDQFARPKVRSDVAFRRPGLGRERPRDDGRSISPMPNPA